MNKNEAIIILEINFDNITQEELDRCYRKKCIEKHPDRHPNDPKASDNFRRVNEAYDCLKECIKKKEEESQTNWVVAVTSEMADPKFTPIFKLFGEVGVTLQQMAGVFSSTVKSKKKEQ